MNSFEKNEELNGATEEELTEMLDEIIKEVVGGFVEDYKGDSEKVKTSMLDPRRLYQMDFTYKVLQFLTKGTNTKITYEQHEPHVSMGSVTVEGNLLEFDKPEWFARAAEFATNTEIYPLTNGDVRITFTFHKLTTPIK